MTGGLQNDWKRSLRDSQFLKQKENRMAINKRKVARTPGKDGVSPPLGVAKVDDGKVRATKRKAPRGRETKAQKKMREQQEERYKPVLAKVTGKTGNNEDADSDGDSVISGVDGDGKPEAGSHPEDETDTLRARLEEMTRVTAELQRKLAQIQPIPTSIVAEADKMRQAATTMTRESGISLASKFDVLFGVSIWGVFSLLLLKR